MQKRDSQMEMHSQTGIILSPLFFFKQDILTRKEYSIFKWSIVDDTTKKVRR